MTGKSVMSAGKSVVRDRQGVVKAVRGYNAIDYLDKNF